LDISAVSCPAPMSAGGECGVGGDSNVTHNAGRLDDSMTSYASLCGHDKYRPQLYKRRDLIRSPRAKILLLLGDSPGEHLQEHPERGAARHFDGIDVVHRPPPTAGYSQRLLTLITAIGPLQPWCMHSIILNDSSQRSSLWLHMTWHQDLRANTSHAPTILSPAPFSRHTP
jgi:hypothetical protein